MLLASLLLSMTHMRGAHEPEGQELLAFTLVGPTVCLTPPPDCVTGSSLRLYVTRSATEGDS